ncbi:MAG: hypothetical protein SH847_16880 [Roseiflexaceae bacterium]|nr:hypothetical protein [Roseiflexaceae bacterium]
MISDSAPNQQTFCSFLAVIGPPDDQRFDYALNSLPRYLSGGQELRSEQMRCAIFAPNANPLHQFLLLQHQDRILFVQGDFYQAVDRSKLQSALDAPDLDSPTLRLALANMNGTFNGFLADTASGACAAFTDQFGFSFLYYLRDGNRTWIASSLWPLLRLAPDRGRMSGAGMQDILLLGYPTGDRTAHENVFAVQPGRIVRIDHRGIQSDTYVPTPVRQAQAIDQAIERFQGAFRDHFSYVSERIGRDRFVATITGGHDTRVVLNAMLGSGVTPMCITGTGFPTQLTEDAMRAMHVAHVAGCPRAMVDYTRPDDTLAADSFILSEGGGTGLWMANLAIASRSYGDVLYCGFSGDVLSGSPEAVNPSQHHGIESLAHEVFLSNYEYQADPQQLAAELLGVHLDDVLDRYTQTFAPYATRDLHDAYQMQNIDNRNFRRIGYFAGATKIGLPSASLFHDRAIAQAYRELPPDLLINERLHRKLCYTARPALAWIPANPWHVPMPFEPLLWNYVRGPAKKAVRLLRTLRASHTEAPTPANARNVALDPRYNETLALIERANVLDTTAVRQALAAESYDHRGHILSFRLSVLAKLALFTRGETIPEIEHVRLFPRITRMLPIQASS